MKTDHRPNEWVHYWVSQNKVLSSEEYGYMVGTIDPEDIVKLDEGLASIVMAYNQAGISTKHSCYGHINDPNGYMYITIDKDYINYASEFYKNFDALYFHLDYRQYGIINDDYHKRNHTFAIKANHPNYGNAQLLKLMQLEMTHLLTTLFIFIIKKSGMEYKLPNMERFSTYLERRYGK